MNELMPDQRISLNKQGPLWHGCYDVACPCCSLSVTWFRSILGERTHSHETLASIYTMTDSMIEQICEGFMIVELTPDEGLAPCTTWLISACNLNPRLDTICAALNDETLKKSSTYLLLSNRCIAIIESSYLDIHNSISFMYPINCNFIQNCHRSVLIFYINCNTNLSFWINGLSTRAYLQREYFKSI